MGAQNFNFAHKSGVFSSNLAFLDHNFRTRRKRSDNPNFFCGGRRQKWGRHCRPSPPATTPRSQSINRSVNQSTRHCIYRL